MTEPIRRRRGFTLLTTLWVMTVASTLTVAAAVSGRRAVDAARNRVELERLRWRALGCAKRVQSAIDRALADTPTPDEATRLWRELYRAIDASPLLSNCDVTLEAAGTRLDLNAASGESAHRLFDAVGLPSSDSLTDAFLDWRDSDDVALPNGAESEWYRELQRTLPRNGPFSSEGELSYVRGFETAASLDSLVTTEPGRVSLATASVPVLMSVPGISRELAERVVDQRATSPVRDLADLAGGLSESALAELVARYPDAQRLTTPDPDAWLLRVRAAAGVPPVGLVISVRLVRAGDQVRVVSLRSEP